MLTNNVNCIWPIHWIRFGLFIRDDHSGWLVQTRREVSNWWRHHIAHTNLTERQSWTLSTVCISVTQLSWHFICLWLTTSWKFAQNAPDCVYAFHCFFSKCGQVVLSVSQDITRYVLKAHRCLCQILCYSILSYRTQLSISTDIKGPYSALPFPVLGTAVHAERSRVRFPMGSLKFIIDLVLPHSASNRNAYQQFLLGVKAAVA